MTAPVRSTPRSGITRLDQAEILIVDDHADNLRALEAILEPLGQNVVRANSGDAALRMLQDRDFAVVLLDVQMPGMSGLETAEIIKSHERTRCVPVILLTAGNDQQDRVLRGYLAGAVDYMSKPFQPDVLRAKVATFVDMHLNQKRLTARQAVVREAELRMTELRHARELVQSEARFREIMGSAMDAVVIFNRDETITFFNRAAERVFERPAPAAVGRTIGELFPSRKSAAEIQRTCAARLARAARPRVSASDSDPSQNMVSLIGSRASGVEFPIEASISCFDGPEGRQFTLIVRDVSERVRQESEMRQQAMALERAMTELEVANGELNRRQVDLERAMTARSRFYASMSHELRTPINAVLGYSTLLLENIYGSLNEKQTDGIRRTQRAAKHLLELVNDVLDLSKIEAGKLDLRMQPVEFPAIVEELFVSVRPLAEKYGASLSLESEPHESIEVISDPRRVRQILLNLLSNAIKFGLGKPIRVQVGRAADDGVTVAVIDQGHGIPPEDQERVFQEFVQLGKTQLQEGTGLGLPISRRLSQLLNGSLSLRSQTGIGSTFQLTLPASAEPRAPRVSDQEKPQLLSDERRRVETDTGAAESLTPGDANRVSA